jgi:type IV secretion system protein VirD4
MTEPNTEDAVTFGGVVAAHPVISLVLLAVGCLAFWRYVLPVGVSAVDAIRHSRTVQLALVFLLAAATVGLWNSDYWPTAAVAVAVPVGVVWHRRRRSSNVVQRWSRRSRRTHGVATTVEILRNSSRWAVRRKATTVRPSLADRSRLDRLTLPTSEVAVKLARVGIQTMWAPTEDVIVTFGAPRSGKSGWMAGRIIDAPGACLVTSTRTDLYKNTVGMRRERGPVHVFNAAGLAELDSTITFDPLTGCDDPVTAHARAADMIGANSSGGQSGDREWWDNQSRRTFAGLLHAAALGNRTMHDVHRWVAAPEESGLEVLSLLRSRATPAFEQEVTQFLSQHDKTQSSVTLGVMPALEWLASPYASVAGSNSYPFNVEELLSQQATIYLFGAEEAATAPLICALTGHIAREARRLASLQPDGRLDPNFTLALDEAALISPVPLESWTADMGGRGITIIPAFQSRAQLLDRWGAVGSAIIINNASTVMLFGGAKDDADLKYWSGLAGDRDEPVETRSANGRVSSRSIRKVPVFPPAQLSNLPAFRAVVFRRGQQPSVGRVEMVWDRRDWNAHRRSVGRPVTVGRPRSWAPAFGRVVGRG